ncbi:MAG TPA: AAA family ATPase [Streptosporangiaceae bacterium]|jgi:DNA-binding CsgD family transcriptional regulator/tetratricopeptide (TPR) repeat protein|nr:AAA family ATPase [Streptosporangiaceae bacterium]
MAAHSGLRAGGAGLADRRAERAVLDQVLTAVRAGQSRVLVVHGEPGVGKSALVDDLAGRAAGCRVVRVAGVQSEMELAFAGLHQLCAPLLEQLEHLEGLPGPQRDALRTAFGISAGPAPDRFLVGLAVLGLVSEAAGDRPLVCVVEDQQWLDRASAQALGFVARRLGADPVGLVFTARVRGDDLAGLPELVVEGLPADHARALLDSALTGSLDARVRDQIVAETRGNPLALLELPRGLTPGELAGGFGLPGAVPLDARIEDSFGRQLDALPEQTRRLVQLAAADPSGDASLVWRAAGRLGISVQAGRPAVAAGLVEFAGRVRFRHPLARSAAYWSASVEDRQQMHAALAAATDAAADPDRRAWHRAAAAAGPDEQVAAELEDSAGRAQARGGLAAAAAFLERAVLLTADPGRRAGRTLAAAQASVQAGAFDRALELLAAAEAGPLDELQSARADLLRGQVAFASGSGSDAPPLLLKAARRLEPLNLDLARETYLDTWHAAMFAGHLAAGADLVEVSRAARALPPPADPPRPVDLLLDGLARLVTDGPAVAAPTLRQAVSAFARGEIPVEHELRWGWMATVAGAALRDHDRWRMTARQVQLAREAGALRQLPILLSLMAVDAVWMGDFAAATSLIAEYDAVCEATGSRIAPHAALLLASFRGREAEAAPLIQAVPEEATARGQGFAVTYAYRAAAILYNGLSRHQEALTAARQAIDHAHIYASVWVLPELIEAAARTGEMRLAADALDRLAGWTRAGGYEFGLGIEARARALLSEGEAAEGYYREAIGRLGGTRGRPELARAHLLYGEWLRRERRHGEAREQLRTACQLLAAIGMEGFAERARRELAAAGETTRRPATRPARTLPGPGSEPLTAQEAQVARLARDGLSNPEIGARLFISARTVKYHLSKVFTKLGISSRGQLHRVLPADPDPVPPR